jgi:hypothetical protein
MTNRLRDSSPAAKRATQQPRQFFSAALFPSSAQQGQKKTPEHARNAGSLAKPTSALSNWNRVEHREVELPQQMGSQARIRNGLLVYV